MSNVKRFISIIEENPEAGDEDVAVMVTDDRGDYVLFTDYEAAIEAENRRWQDAIYEACKAVAVECGRPTHAIDGGGSDSGDGLDFTLAEIAQAFDILREAKCADYERLRDALEWAELALEEIDEMSEVNEFGLRAIARMRLAEVRAKYALTPAAGSLEKPTVILAPTTTLETMCTAYALEHNGVVFKVPSSKSLPDLTPAAPSSSENGAVVAARK